MKLRIFAIILAANGFAFAQGTSQSVFPPGFESTPGNSSDPVLQGSAEFQQIFRASSLSATWTTPVQITDIAFRLNENASSFNEVYPRLEIRLSTTQRAPELITTQWSQNSGPDSATVFLHDNVSLFAPGGKTLNPFELRIHLDNPFTYDPASGHLAMYIKPTISGAGGTRNIDAEGFSTPNAPVWSTTSNFVTPVPQGVITEFSWVSVPEPKSTLYVLFGGLGLILKRRR